MPSDNIGARRQDSDDQEIPAELTKREAQDRAKGSGHATSPVDSMHVDAEKKQENRRGHATNNE